MLVDLVILAIKYIFLSSNRDVQAPLEFSF